MKIYGLKPNDVVNYRLPSLFVGMGTCNWKCCVEAGLDKSICQNSELATSPRRDVPADELCSIYNASSIDEAIVIGGLEPLDDIDGLLELIEVFDKRCVGDIVIYTGYTEDEKQDVIVKKILPLIKNNCLIVKFGRFVPGQEKHLDTTLGVKLASDNQYAKLYLEAKHV